MSKVNNQSVLKLVDHIPPLDVSLQARESHELLVKEFLRKNSAPLSSSDRRKIAKAKKNASLNAKRSVPLHRMDELKAALRRH